MSLIVNLIEIAWPYVPAVLYALGLPLTFSWIRLVSNGGAGKFDYACVVIWPVTVFVTFAFLAVAFPVRGIHQFLLAHHPFIAWHPVMWDLPSWQPAHRTGFLGGDAA